MALAIYLTVIIVIILLSLIWRSRSRKARLDRFRQSAGNGTACYVFGSYGRKIPGIVHRRELGRVYFIPRDCRDGLEANHWYDTDEIYPLS